MLLIFKGVFWYLTIGLLIILSSREQVRNSKDIIKMKIEEEKGIKKSDVFWLNSVMIVFVILWPLIIYKVIKAIRDKREDS